MHSISLYVNLLVGLFTFFTHEETTSRNHDSECVHDLHILSVTNYIKCIPNYLSKPMTVFQLLAVEPKQFS